MMNNDFKLFFVSSNNKKIIEAQVVLPFLKEVALDLPEIQSLNPHEIIKFKLQEAWRSIKKPVLVDDTSLYLDCLSSLDGSRGLPGPFIKWYLKTLTNRGIYEMAYKLGNVKATAYTILGLALSADELYIFDGTLNGTLINPTEEIGSGWDEIFMPEEYNTSLSKISTEVKSIISMRALALQKLKKFLQC